MIVRLSQSRPLPRSALVLALLALAMAATACADMNDTMLSAFADPAQFDLYDCKQLVGQRQSLTMRAAELEGLMAKADTGVAGPVVAELAYRNEYISVRAQSRLADQAWKRNKCQSTTPGAAQPAAAAVAPAASAKGSHPPRSGSAIY